MLRYKLRLKRLSCVRPSFVEGMARLVDIGGTLRDDYDKVVPHPRSTRYDVLARINQIHNGGDAADAMASDWKAIATDLRIVTARLMDKYNLPSSKT